MLAGGLAGVERTSIARERQQTANPNENWTPEVKETAGRPVLPPVEDLGAPLEEEPPEELTRPDVPAPPERAQTAPPADERTGPEQQQVPGQVEDTASPEEGTQQDAGPGVARDAPADEEPEPQPDAPAIAPGTAMPRLGEVHFPELSPQLREAAALELPESVETAGEEFEQEAPSKILPPDSPDLVAEPGAPLPEDPVLTGPLPATRYEITGNDYLIDRVLRDTADTYLDEDAREGGAPLNAAGVDDAAYGMELLYHQRGFPDATVDWSLSGDRQQVVFEVDEGPAVSLGQITFEGNERFSDGRLRQYLVRPTEKRAGREGGLLNAFDVDGKMPYVQNDLEEGTRDIENFYINQGFFQAEVSEPEVTRTNGKANVTVTLTEGPRYQLGEVSFQGNEEFSRETLLKQIDVTGRQFFSNRFLELASAELQSFYQEHGHFSASVEPEHEEVTDGDQVVDVTFVIESGPLYEIAQISVEGNEDLKSEYFQRMFKPVMGHVYDPDEIQAINRELINSGLFRSIRIEPRPVGIPAATDDDTPGSPVEGAEATQALGKGPAPMELVVKVEEAKDVVLSFYGGYSSFEGPVAGTRVDLLNLFGMGRSLSLRADYSGIGLNGEVIYHDPWLLGRYWDFELSLSATTRDYDGYRLKSIGLEARGIWDATDHFSLTALLGGSAENTDPLRLKKQNLGPQSYQEVYAGVSQKLDYLDDPLAPTQGWQLISGLEYFASAVDHLPANIRGSYHWPVSKKGVLSFGTQIVAIFGVSDNLELPIDQRTFNGGSRSVRSFQARDLGPVEEGSGSPLGGLYKSAYTIEYTHRLGGMFRLAAFTDAGNNLPDLGGLPFDEMRYAIGVGVRVDLPVGPLRIDYGLNPNPTEDESRGALHISFGTFF